MQQILESLQQVQKDLVGIIVTAIASIVVSIVTLVVNSVIQFKLSDRQYKSIQFEIMREIYPQFKSELIAIDACFDNINCNPIKDDSFSIEQYFCIDWTIFRKNTADDKINYVDNYITNIKNICSHYEKLNSMFKEKNFPTSNKKVQKAINSFQTFCSYYENYSKDSNNRKQKIFNQKEIKKLLKICDKHYNKF